MSKKIVPVPVRKLSRKRCFTVYGRSGTGKTTFFSTFPRRRLLLDVADRGTDSVADVPYLDVLTIDSWQKFEDVYQWLKENPGKYESICVDTVTQLQDLAIREEGRKRKRGGRAGDFGTLSQSQWGTISGKLKDWLGDYRNLYLSEEEGGINVDVCFLGQDRVFNLDDAADRNLDSAIDPEVSARLMPSVVGQLNAMSDVIACTFVRMKTNRKTKERTAQYCLRIGPNDVYTTKIRKPRGVELPDYLVDPTYEDIVALIKGAE